MRGLLGKIQRFITGKRAQQTKAIIPERKDMPAALLQEARLELRPGPKRVTKTAVVCLLCSAPLLRHKNNKSGIQYTCTDICRKMLRGGKRNLRILKRLAKREGESWSYKQRIMIKLKVGRV